MDGSERGWAAAAAVSPLLTPALMVYLLCCWPGDAKSDTSSGDGPRARSRAGSRRERERAGATRRASDLFHRKLASSVVSLHLPSTSGHKKEPLSAHRSHEEIRRHGRAAPGAAPSGGPEPTSRYHSAPSVIDEVLHRRDWERSTRDLHIPLRSPDGSANMSCHSEQSPLSQPWAPRADPECSSLEDQPADDRDRVLNSCKKHYTNIKSSKRKEKEIEDKDCDATEILEPSTFYIGDNDLSVCNSPLRASAAGATGATGVTSAVGTGPVRVFQAKEAKQSFNESIRRCDRPRASPTLVPLDEHRPRFGFTLDDVIDRLDRSGATHHSIESRVSLSRPPHPPPSVEAVGYEGGACYLRVTSRADDVTSHGDVTAVSVTSRARHASDGDILAPAHAARPESGAFSESDLDLEVEVAPEELPPPYEELHHFASPKKKETAI